MGGRSSVDFWLGPSPAFCAGQSEQLIGGGMVECRRGSESCVTFCVLSCEI